MCSRIFWRESLGAKFGARFLVARCLGRSPVFRGPLTLGLFARERSKILACGNPYTPARNFLHLCGQVTLTSPGTLCSYSPFTLYRRVLCNPSCAWGSGLSFPCRFPAKCFAKNSPSRLLLGADGARATAVSGAPALP